MIWVIRILVIIGIGFFALGLCARIPTPTTYAGERFAYQLALWFMGLLIEIFAGLAYLAYKFL